MSGSSHLCSGCLGKFGPPGAGGRCRVCSLVGRFTDLLYSDRLPGVLVDSVEDICREAYHRTLEVCDGHLARLEHLAATREALPEVEGKGDKRGSSPGQPVKGEIQEHTSTAAKTKPAKPEDRGSHFAEPVEPGASSPRRPPRRESPSPEVRKRKRRHRSSKRDKKKEKEERPRHPSPSKERECPAEGRRIERKRRKSPTPEEFEDVRVEEEESEESPVRPRSSGRGSAPGTRVRRSPPRRSETRGRRAAEPSGPPPGSKGGKGHIPAWPQRGRHWGKNKGKAKREREQQYRRYGKGTGDRRRKVLRRPAGGAGKARARPKGLAKAKVRFRPPGRGGALRRPAAPLKEDVEPEEDGFKEVWKAGREEWLDLGEVEIIGNYWKDLVKVAGLPQGIKVEGGEVYLSLVLTGAISEQVLKWASGQKEKILRVHLCPEGRHARMVSCMRTSSAQSELEEKRVG